MGGGSKGGGSKGGGPKGGRPKISRFFFPVPPQNSLSGGLLVEFWWCFEDPQRGKKRTNFAAGEGKIERNFGRSRRKASKGRAVPGRAQGRAVPGAQNFETPTRKP